MNKNGEPPAKRARLSMACNECRRRKVKCDAVYPKCRNCAQRNHECFTSDSRRPNVSVLREWIEDRSSTVATSTVMTGRIQDVLNHSPAAGLPQTANTPSPSTPVMDKISPLQLPYEMSFNVDHHSNRLKMLGSSSAQCLTKSLDLYLEKARLKPILPCFRYGLRHTEELDIPFLVTLPTLPAESQCDKYLNQFFATIHMLWPLCTVDETKAAIHALASIQDFSMFARDHIPVLALSYLIMSLGADEAAQTRTADGTKYLNAAASLIGHVLMVPYLDAVQALLAYAIAFRGRNKDGLAWQMIGMATRIAQTLGLHKHSVTPSHEHGVTEKNQQQFHARIWAICCCLEKTLQLEGGRPSSILTVSDDQLMGDQRPSGRPNFLLWNMTLAEQQNGICEHIYGHKPGKRRADDILQNTAQLDNALLSWSNSLPLEYRPENVMFCFNEHFSVAAFLCIQFHQAVITLHRAALIAPRGLFDAEVDKSCPDGLSRFRIKGGETICLDSARAIIRITLEVVERGMHSPIHSLGPIILSCIALAIYLMKHRRGKSQGADLELLRSGLEYTNEQYTASGQDHRVGQGLASIYEKVKLHLQGSTNNSDPGKAPGSYHQSDRALTSTSSSNSGNHIDSDPANASQGSQGRIQTSHNSDAESSTVNAASDDYRSEAPSGHLGGMYSSLASSNDTSAWDSTIQPVLAHPFPLQYSDDVVNGTISQNRLSIEPLPFDQYSMETMWDWMM